MVVRIWLAVGTAGVPGRTAQVGLWSGEWLHARLRARPLIKMHAAAAPMMTRYDTHEPKKKRSEAQSTSAATESCPRQGATPHVRHARRAARAGGRVRAGVR